MPFDEAVFEIVETPPVYNVPEGYALLAGARMPAVVTEEELSE